MLNINPELVCNIITKAREFHAKEDVEIPEGGQPNISPNDDWYEQILENFSDDYTYQELRYSINDLEPDQQATLVALMWIGRGDYDATEWKDVYQEAYQQHNNRTAEYLLATPMVADYLEEGLKQLGYSCES